MGYQALAQAQLAEDVHHDLHGRVVGDGEGAHVQDGAQLQGPRAVGGQRGGVLCEVDPGGQHDALLLTPRVLWGTGGEEGLETFEQNNHVMDSSN